jgi:hypothetical protein
LNRVILGTHRERQWLFTAAWLPHIEVIFAGLDGETEADDSEPRVAMPHDHHGPATERDGGNLSGRSWQPESRHAARDRRDARRDESAAAKGRRDTQGERQSQPREIVSHLHP